MQNSPQELGADLAALLRKLEQEASLTNSNILSDPEWVRGRLLLSKAEHAFSGLDREIGHDPGAQHSSPLLEHQLVHSMIAQHGGDLGSTLAKMRIALAPHKRLHTELLAEIFLHCVGNHPIAFPLIKSHPPWTLGRVCSRWRNIVRSDSRIWNSISVGYTYPPLRAVEAACTVLPSAGLLSIALMCVDLDAPTEPLDLLIIPHLARIRRLELTLPYITLLRLYEMPPEHFSVMESLKLVVITSSSGSPITDDVLQRLRDAPVFMLAKRLLKLSLWSIYSSILNALLNMRVPWHQVTDLELRTAEDLPLLVVLRIFRQCDRLVTFSVDSIAEHATQNTDVSGIRLLHLQCLTLTLEDSCIFDYLFVPALTRLDVSGDVPVPNANLSTMLVRSGCDLRVLEYYGEHEPDISVLHDFLRNVPTLLSFRTGPSLVLHQCTLEKITSRELLPRLEIMAIRLDSLTAYVDLVEARVRGGPRGGALHSVEGYFVRRPHTFGVDMHAARERLKILNQEYGTDFMLMEE